MKRDHVLVSRKDLPFGEELLAWIYPQGSGALNICSLKQQQKNLFLGLMNLKSMDEVKYGKLVSMPLPTYLL